MAAQIQWATSQAKSVCGKHEILSSQTAVFCRMQSRGFCIDDNQGAGVVKDVEVWIREHIPMRVERRLLFKLLEESRFSAIRILLQQLPSLHHSKCPRLFVQGAGA